MEYLQQNIFKSHEFSGHQVGAKPETSSIGKIHHGLCEGKRDPEDVCLLQSISGRQTIQSHPIAQLFRQLAVGWQ